MINSVKRIAILLLPPVVTDLLRRLRQRRALPTGAGESQVVSAVQELRAIVRETAPEWEAVAESDWIVSNGWLHQSIVDTQVEKWAGFAGSIVAPKALGMAHEATPGTPVNVSAHNIIMTFAYVLGRAITTASHRPITVLDWGGGIGHYAMLAKELYPETPIDYTISELPPLAEAGRKLVPGATFTSDGVAELSRGFDLIYASSSLQYVQDIYAMLARMAASGSRWIMICRMPFVDQVDDFVVVQRPGRYGYDTEYTGWFLNRGKFVGFMQQHGYQLDREFLNDERPVVTGAAEQCSYRGFLFRRIVPAS